jgi:hypothetical protein
MNEDLVTELRRLSDCGAPTSKTVPAMRQAADEIEWLRKVMLKVASMPGYRWFLCQLALAEAAGYVPFGSDNLDYIMSYAEEEK